MGRPTLENQATLPSYQKSVILLELEMVVVLGLELELIFMFAKCYHFFKEKMYVNVLCSYLLSDKQIIKY